ncbi:MAG: hypothetical protein ABSF50_05945 [Burkholderiaceae bacterium]|jgi:hypothetical protein
MNGIPRRGLNLETPKLLTTPANLGLYALNSEDQVAFGVGRNVDTSFEFCGTRAGQGENG